jgi:hypothetical protein
MDFLKTHLIKKIKSQVKEKQQILKHEGFLFFDTPIDDGKKVINRIMETPYPKEELLPIGWYNVKGSTLLDMYAQLKDNDFYIYKLYQGKSHKMRIKKR